MASWQRVMNQLLEAYLYNVLTIKICTLEFHRRVENAIQASLMGMSSRMFMVQVTFGLDGLPILVPDVSNDYHWQKEQSVEHPFVCSRGLTTNSALSRLGMRLRSSCSCGVWTGSTLFSARVVGTIGEVWQVVIYVHTNKWPSRPWQVCTVIIGLDFRLFIID